MKFKVYVKQYFDTYLEWEKLYSTAETREEANELKVKADKQYNDGVLVSYDIYIEEVVE